MTFAIGGSAKVRRVVKQARTEPWKCRCIMGAVHVGRDHVTPIETKQPAYLTRCGRCGTRRP